MDLFLFTFNCGKRNPPPVIDSIESHLPSKCPDLFVFAFQEVSSIMHGTCFNTIDQIIKVVSEQSSADLSLHYNREVKEVGMCHFGNVALIVLTSEEDKVADVIKSRGVAIGLYHSRLKGAIGLRLDYKGQMITFVALHLNAGEKKEHYHRRNDDLRGVLTGVKFDDGLSVLKPGSHCFMLGDFNYRVNSSGEDEFNYVLGSQLALFKEALITFEPSYKLKVGSDQYNAKRTPSWCDRIVYLSSDAVQVQEYNLIKENTHSDHKPVFMHVEVPLSSPSQPITQSDMFGYDVNHEINYRLATVVNRIMWLGLFITTTPTGIVLVAIILSLVILYAL